MSGPRTVGGEKEFLLVDPETGRPQAVAEVVLDSTAADAELTGELQREQIETNTRPCQGLSDLGRELRAARLRAGEPQPRWASGPSPWPPLRCR